MDFRYQYSSNVPTDQLLDKFGNLTFPDLRKKRSSRLPKTCDIVIALEAEKMVGLLVGSKQTEKKSASILSLVVAPKFRKQGIAGQLLSIFEKGMKRQHIKALSIHYRSHWPSAPIMEKLLSNCGWSSPKEDFVIVEGKAKKVLQLFSAHEDAYPTGYYTVPWSDLSQEQIGKIKSRFLSDEISADQNPFVSPKTINKTCSLALFKNQINVGWVVSHIISDSTNEFTSYYIAPEFRSFSLAHKLMRETIYRQHRLTKQANFIIVSKASNYVMSRFLLRHAEKTEVKLVKTLISIKII